MQRISLIFVAISGFMAVALGAFGAHALKNHLSIPQLTTWETAVHYHFFHTLALLAIACLPNLCTKWKQRSMFFLMCGIVLFSGSLYVLVLSTLGWLGMITPIGGMFFLLAWLSLGIAAWQNKP